MHFNEVEDVLLLYLQEEQGRFITAYQICRRIEQDDPALWQRLLNAYPAPVGNPDMGHGAGIYYSSASFIANALIDLSRSNGHVVTERIASKDLIIEGVEPGSIEGPIGIWAWHP